MNLDYNPDVLTCLASLSSDEVFTPPHIATQMLDMLPIEIWSNPKAKFLDPFCKSGVFLREITVRLLDGLQKHIPDLQERIDHIMLHQVFGVGITELTALLARRSLYCSKWANGEFSVTKAFNDEAGNIQFENIPHTWEGGRCKFCGVNFRTWGEEARLGLEYHAYQFIHDKNPYAEMNFEVIIGNPPYQHSDGAEINGAMPIYQKFILEAMKMRPRYICMITPSRWFTGGRGLDSFRETMINSQSLAEIHDFPNAADVFNGVEIKGGVSFFLWDREHKNDCLITTYEGNTAVSQMKRPLKETDSDVLIRINEAIPIYRKVKSYKEKSMSDLISSAKPFGFRTYFKGSRKGDSGSVKIYVNGGVGYVRRDEVTKNSQWIDQHKVIVPYAIGSGDGKSDQVKPIYAGPNTCCTETYIVFGPFRSEEKCKNVISYINTRFFHFFLTLKKNTQHTTKEVYQFVPLQDFSESWNDKKLYEKYSLNDDEIDFIERTILPGKVLDFQSV